VPSNGSQIVYFLVEYDKIYFLHLPVKNL